MAVNVNVNGANTEMMKRVFQSFVKLAVKKKKKNLKVSQKTQIIKSYSTVKEIANKKACRFKILITVKLDIAKDAMII